MSYHIPVLLRESTEALEIKPEGLYVDLTFGGGGHSETILEKLTSGKLIAFDRDVDARMNLQRFDRDNFLFIEADFRYFDQYLKLNKIKKVDGILADLGISSYQIDTGVRGFSVRFEGPLDMRMDRNGRLNARDVVNDYSERDLVRILSLYGEVKNARTAAQNIVKQRIKEPIETTEDLKKALTSCTPRGKEHKYLGQVFQAIRIEVNDELGALKDMLLHAVDILQLGGRLVIITYHSLEDRLVKNFFKTGKFEGEVEKDVFGNERKPFRQIGKPILPTEEELKHNNRARSAKLRIAEKIT